MEIIRQKLIPPELLYQISSFKEKKESIKESLQKNIERTNDFIKDYSKQILGMSKIQSDKSSGRSLISKSKMTSVIDKSISTSATDRTISDRQEVIVTKLFDKLISEKSSSIESKEKYTKELIQDVRRDKEITTRDRRSTRDIYRERQGITDHSKIEKDTRNTDRIRKSDRSSEWYEKQLIASSADKSRIHVSESISDRNSFLNSVVKESITKDSMGKAILEAVQSTTTDKSVVDKVIDREITNKFITDKISTFDKSFASNVVSKAISEKIIDRSRLSDKSSISDKFSTAEKSISDKLSKLITAEKISISDKLITAEKDKSIIKEKLASSIDKSVVDKAIDKSIFDRLVSENFVEKSAASQSLIDKVVNRLAIDSSHVSDRLINKSSIKEMIAKSTSDEVLHSLKYEVNKAYIDKAISELIKERIVERSFIQNANLQKNVDFTKSILQSSEIDKSRESIREVIAESKTKDLKESVSKTKDKTVIEKSISFVKNIAETVQKIIPTINPQPVMVMSPVVIRDTISKTESFTKLKSKQLKNMHIASNFIKMVESRTNQTIQQLASGGRVKGSSPHSRADNISINATAGEFMQPVDVVKFYTNKGMEAIRQKIIPREVIAHYANNIQLPKPNYSHAFALGGEIPKTRETSDSAADKAGDKQFNIVNLIDPAVFGQYLASSTGEDQLMNVISANKFSIKGILGS